MSYCFDIPAARDFSAARRGVAVEIPCVPCMVTEKIIIIGRMASKRSVKDTTIVRMRYMAALKKRTLEFRHKIESIEEEKVQGIRKRPDIF